MSPLITVLAIGMSVIGLAAAVAALYLHDTDRPAYWLSDDLVRAMADPTTEWVNGVLVPKIKTPGQPQNLRDLLIGVDIPDETV